MNRRIINVERSTSTAHRLLHYDGDCSNIHGHNMKWEVDITVNMGDTGEDNMPIDFKEISDCIDRVDHCLLLNKNDPMLERGIGKTMKTSYISFEGDPTCELLVRWMAERLYNLSEDIVYAGVECSETDKYTMAYSYQGEGDLVEFSVEEEE